MGVDEGAAPDGAAFEPAYRRAAGELAERVGDPRLGGVTVSERTWERWWGGQTKKPRPDQCRVLEHMFARPVRELLDPAPQDTPHLASPAGLGTPRMPMHTRAEGGASASGARVDSTATTAFPSRRPLVTVACVSRTAGDRGADPDTDRLLEIARDAVKAQDKLTRKVVAQAIRGQEIPLSNDRLTALMVRLRETPGQHTPDRTT